MAFMGFTPSDFKVFDLKGCHLGMPLGFHVNPRRQSFVNKVGSVNVRH